MQCGACAGNGSAVREERQTDGGMENTKEETAKLAGRAAGQTMLALSFNLGKGLGAMNRGLCASRRVERHPCQPASSQT